MGTVKNSAGLRWPPLLVVLALLCATTPGRLFALDPHISLLQYNCRTWTPANGLPVSGVSALAQTDDGYIWLGTTRGLVRFDGSEFKLFDLSGVAQMRSFSVTSLAKSRGGFWFGLERGAFGFYDGRSASFSGKTDWGGVNLNVNSLMTTREGDLWIAAETLAARLASNQQFETFLTGETLPERCDVKSLFQDSRGRLWMGTVHQGLYYWQDGKLTRFPDRTLDDSIVRCITEDHQGQLWVGTQTGFRCYDTNFQRRTDLPATYYETMAILTDREGVVWMGTTGGGLIRYQNHELARFQKRDGLAGDFVTALAEDEEGSLWVGTRSGLSQLIDVKIPTFGQTEGLPTDLCVAVSPAQKGCLWIATDQGVTWFDGNPRSLYPTNAGLIYVNYPTTYFTPQDGSPSQALAYPTISTNSGLHYNYVTSAFEASNGDLYVINGKMDIEVFSGGKFVARYLNQAWPTAFGEDEHSVLVCVGGDLYRVGTNSFTPYVLANGERPPRNWIFNMVSAKDHSIWAAGGDGLLHLKDGTCSLLLTNQSAADSKVTWVCEDKDGIIWAGSERGLTRLKDGKTTTFTRNDGLFDNIIYAVVPDDHGSLWVDSSRGFFRVTLKNLNDFAEDKADSIECTPYAGFEAVKTAEASQRQASGCKTQDGKIWFTTTLGAAKIDPDHLSANSLPPRVQIQSARANDQELELTTNAPLRPGKGELEFHWAGLSYVAPEKILYRYKLEGYDQDWVEAGPRRAAFYTNLKPGRYRFHVQACNADGIWSRSASSPQFQLLPHYYQTGWFLLLVVLAFAAALAGVFSWRVRHLTSKQKQLQQARDLLEAKVEERTVELKKEVEERKRMQSQVERIHRDLVDASRRAGMAEVAADVLHSIGNALNSVNVSANLVSERLKTSRFQNVAKAATLMREHSDDLGSFMTQDSKGRQLPTYLERLAEQLNDEQSGVLKEIDSLTRQLDYVKEIVATQQGHAGAALVQDIESLPKLVEDALRLNTDALTRHQIQVVKQFEPVPDLLVDRHKVVQILENLIKNASQAMAGSTAEKRLTLQIGLQGVNRVRVAITDNGIGIQPENLTRIFAAGAFSRSAGHGFGLHTGSLAARQLGGELLVHSDGPGKGATFTLELPLVNSSSPSLVALKV
jgi:ligand-binding sensor domain-containing protein/signal transduction histidine kinase